MDSFDALCFSISYNFSFALPLFISSLPPQVYYLEKVTEIQEEFEAFDVFSLVGELGGALGLFLGWSCLNLLLDLVQVPIDRMRKRGRKLSSFGAGGAGAKEAHGVQVLKV